MKLATLVKGERWAWLVLLVLVGMVAKLVTLPVVARAVLLALLSMEAELARLANLAVAAKLATQVRVVKPGPVAPWSHLLDARGCSRSPTRTWSKRYGTPSGCRRATSSSRMFRL